ncbi:hypothetical protein ACQP3J_33445, partial [Escherichia coli]
MAWIHPVIIPIQYVGDDLCGPTEEIISEEAQNFSLISWLAGTAGCLRKKPRYAKPKLSSWALSR